MARGERARARLDREGAATERERARLRGRWNAARSAERARELGEDRQVGVEPDAIQAPDPKRE